MARARILHLLESAVNPRYRALLEAELASLDEQLASLQPPATGR